MKPAPSNVAHSVRTRLIKIAKADGEEFNYVLIRYALERFLFRLSRSPHRDRFVLKGAMLFRAWLPRVHRPTKDLDLLGYGPPEPARLARVFMEICEVAVDDDGMVFDPQSVRAAVIKEGAEYEGVRVTFKSKLGTARFELQVDVGFGDAVVPTPTELDFPTLLPMPAPRLRAYARETVVAEKVHAMVHLGVANSRMKDFFDIWFLSQSFDFNGAVLVDSIRTTFARRRTPLPKEAPVALTHAFTREDSKQKQWKAFTSRLELGTYPPTLEALMPVTIAFLLEPLRAAETETPFPRMWKAGGSWEQSLSG